MDAVDTRILSRLQENGRISMRDLGAEVGLSGPAVAERVRRLEDSGVVRGYRAVVAPAELGWTIGAFVAVAMAEGRAPQELEAYAANAPEVLECHRLTGED
jgi:Lrp/AsnC family leucine-responsive transcriptional regulator